MFEDERINMEKGKTFRKAIFLATIISLIYLILKVLPFSFVNIISELFIVISGIIILLYGELRMVGIEKDERYYQDKYRFYIKAARVYLELCLFGFACAIPFQLYYKDNSIPLNYLLINLEVLGLIYLSYSFKKAQVHFNYSFLENDNKTYYKLVFKNILKLSGIIGAIYLLAFLLGVFLFLNNNIITFFISLGISFLISWLSLSIDYFVISFLERVSYNEEETRVFLPSIFIAWVVFIILQIAVLILRIKMSQIAEGAGPSGVSMGRLIAMYISYINNCYYFIYAIMGIILSYVLYHTYGKRVCKIGITIIICTLFIKILEPVYYSEISSSLFRDEDIMMRIIDIRTFLSVIVNIIFWAGFLVLEIGLINAKIHHKMIIIIPIIAIIYLIISYILFNNLGYTNYVLIDSIASFVIYVVACLFLCFVKEKKKIEE